MLKSKKTILGAILCAIMTVCLAVGIFSGISTSKTAYALGTEGHNHIGWTGITELPTEAGDYYLTDNITLSATWTVPDGTTNLCLNGHVINANCTEDNKFSVITVGAGATLNLYDCDTTTSHNGYVDSNGLWHLGTGVGTAKAITGGIITGGNATTNGGGINVSGTFNMYGGTIAGNTAQNGGGVSNSKSFTMAGGNIVGNIATTNGGGVYASSVIFVNILTGGTITGNTAQNGGGVYYQVELCFAPGTLITMADGTRQAIETLNIGDSVRVFDHEKGEISSSKIFDVWTYPEKHSGVVKLHFSNDIDVTVVYGHSFFEREQNKYVAVTRDNVSAFVGHEFYNVDNERWETLEGYEFIDGEVDTYVITTEYQLNCVANGMLSNEDGFYTLLTNIFEYGDNLKIDQVKKEQDIANFGLYGYENIKHMSEYVYNILNFQYLKVAFGKNLITENEFNYLEAYYAEVDPELYCDEKEETPVSKSGLLKSPFKAPLLTSSVPTPTSGFYVGGSIKISGNNGGNLYISSGKTITIGTGTVGDGNGVVIPTEDMSIGITLADGTGAFTNVGISADYSSNFFSDNANYGIYFDNVGTESTGDDFLALGYAITNACPEEEDDIDGYITLSKTVANSGETITFNVTVGIGYKLKADSVKATYNDGEKDVELELIGENNAYTFTMPAYAVSVTATFVEKQTISISETPYTCTYNGEPRAFQITSGEGPIPTNLKFEYYVNGAWTESAPTNAGSYNVKITRQEDDTYKAYEKVIEDGLVIEKAEQVIVINDISKIYDASPVYFAVNSYYSPTCTTLGDGVVTVEYKLASEEDTEYTTTAPTNAGDYVVKVSVSEGTNYLAGSETKEFTVSKQTINQVGFSNISQPVATATAPTSATGMLVNTKYIITLTWSPALIEGKFAYETVYTATVTLEIKEALQKNYRFADDITLKGAGTGWTLSTDSTDTKLIYTKTFAKTAHQTVSKVAGIDPTPNSSGYKEAWKCSECNKYFEDEDCTILIGDEEAYNTWKTSDGYLPKLPSEGLSAGVIVAICIGSLLLLLIIIYLIGYFFLYRKGKLDEKKIKVIYKFLPRGKK